VLIASLPIRDIQGGVVSMVQMVTTLLGSRGYTISHIWHSYSVRDGKNRTLWQMLLGRGRIGIEEFTYKGRTAFETGRYFPFFEPLHYLAVFWEWWRIARRFPILQVVSGSNHAGLAFALAGRKFVCWAATTYEEDKAARRAAWKMPRRVLDKLVITPLCRFQERYIYRKCSEIIALSSYTADAISSQFRIPREQILTLPYLIDTERLQPPTRPSTEKIVLFAARYDDTRKNTAMLIQAFGSVVEQVPDARLLLVGAEPPSDLLSLVAKLGVSKSVEFCGSVPVSEMIQIYHRAAVFAISSWQEGLGIVGLEAMACGLPVVSTRCGGPEDYVTDGVTGFLVPLNDAQAMANRLVQLLTNSQLRVEMGARARRVIEKQFSYEQLGGTFDRVYRKIYPELFTSTLTEAERSEKLCGELL
jgi:glycosyltransferase involved in cell wall biosynthesis